MCLLLLLFFLLAPYFTWCQSSNCHEQEQVVYDQAMALYQNDETEQAISVLQIAVDNDSPCSTSEIRGGMWHKLGVFHYILDQYNQADRAYQQAISIRTQLGIENLPDLSRSYHNLGVARKEKGNYSEAINALQQAMEIRRELGEAGAMADTYYELAAVYQQMGEYTLAINYLEATLPIFEEAYGAESYELGQSYNELGITRWKLQQYEQAHQALEQARAIFLAAYGPEDVDVARTFINSGNVFDDQGQKEQALEQYEAALRIYEIAAPQSLVRAAVFNNQGVVLRKQEHYTLAEQALQRSLSLKTEVLGSNPHEEKAAVWDNIGDLYRDQQLYIKALQAYQRAIINRVPGFTDTSFYQNPVLNNTSIPGGWQPLLVVMISKTRTLRLQYTKSNKISDLNTALINARLCDQIIDRLQQEYATRQAKLFLRRSSNQAYEEALLVCDLLYNSTTEQAYLDEAFFFTEKSRAVLLASRLQDNTAQIFAGIPAAVQKQEQAFRADIAYLENKLARIPNGEPDGKRREGFQLQLADYQQAFTAFTQQLEQDYPRYYQQKYHLQMASAEQLDDYMGKEAAWVSYFVGEEAAFAIVRYLGEWELFRLPSPESWRSDFLRLREGIYKQQTTMSAEDFFVLSSTLHEKLWAPLLYYNLPEQLFVSPSGLLFLLPFELLVSDEKAENNWKKTNFLIYQHQFSYAYSASLLLHYQTSARTASQKSFLGIAPSFSSDELPALAYSEDEVNHLQQLLGGQTLLSAAATKTSFIQAAEQYRVLHFSTHASTEAGGWIAFSGTQDSTAKLYLNELYPLQLTADLAVLGACETGSGELIEGEGVLSIAHAFAYAGCPSTVASLWPVYHSTTTTILRGFYAYLHEGYPKDKALRQAKLDYLQNDGLDKISAHPAYWAAFIHFGAPEALYRNNNTVLLLGAATLVMLLLLWWAKRRISQA